MFDVGQLATFSGSFPSRKRKAQAIAEQLVAAGVAPLCALGAAIRSPSREPGAPHCWVLATGGNEETFFDLASVTKPMTAVAVAASGLDPSRALGEWVPELAATASGRASIELLLAHRAGLRATCPLHVPLMLGASVDRARALVTAANARRPEAIGDIPPEGFPPIYSDVGYVLAGEALARFTHGKDAGEAIERLIAAPLGLRLRLGTARGLGDLAVRAAPTEHVGWRGGIVQGQVHDEAAWALTGEGASGHAGMFGTVSAVLEFGCHVLDRIDSLEWLVRERPGGTLRAGFDGKSAEGSSAGARMGPRAFGHLGFTGTSLWIDPDAEIVIALLTNRVHPTRDHVAIRAARPAVHDALFELALELRAPS